MKYPIHVLFLAAEADPFIKIGGLGDVAGSLPLALRSLPLPDEKILDFGEPVSGMAVDARLVLPYYKVLKSRDLLVREVARFKIAHSSGSIPVSVLETDLNGMPVYLIEAEPITGDDLIYHLDASQDAVKFTLFSLAGLELAHSLKWPVHILHANDWHTALAIYALSSKRKTTRFFKNTVGLINVHNMPFLGVGAGAALQPFRLSPATNSALPWWAQDMPLALGLLAADHIIAVSPTYAQEILTPEFGTGLHEFLQTRSEDVSGILNGLDQERWNPQTDPALVTNYSLDTLEGRISNKTALQNELGLEIDTQIPMLAIVSRFDPQKGIDLLPDALRAVSDQPWQAVLLGTGDPFIERIIQDLEVEFSGRLRSIIRFDSDLSRRIYASADALMIPSRYEPCGLTQMIAMRYGCVPVAHATGGLRDTILDYADFGQSTGFLFQRLTPDTLAIAIRRALAVYGEHDLWLGLQRRGMQWDFSWKASAKKYLDLYRSSLTSSRSPSTRKVKP